MPKGNKYKGLTLFLEKSNKNVVELSFKELEKITGGLPPSVYKYRTAWSNNSRHSFSYGWLNAGYKIETDFHSQKAKFIKGGLHKKNSTTAKSFSNNIVTREMLEKASMDVEKDPAYGLEGDAVKRIIKLFPKNNCIDEVIIKLAIIDVTHSTQIFKQKSKATIVDLAKEIVKIENIDEKISLGDRNIVTQIACSTKVHFLSIASKYCACHNQIIYSKDDYYKYDSVVSKQINFKKRDYEQYFHALEMIVKENNLETVVNVRQKLDYYFWYNNRKRI